MPKRIISSLTLVVADVTVKKITNCILKNSGQTNEWNRTKHALKLTREVICLSYRKILSLEIQYIKQSVNKFCF